MRVYSLCVNVDLKMAVVLGAVAVSGFVVASALAETTSDDANPYSLISYKNVFHLNPPPPPPSAEKEKPPDLPKVMLSGFQKVGDHMKVYLAIPAKDPKENVYMALLAGEKRWNVEVVNIRAEKQEVDVVNAGTAMTLSISNNGFALGGGASPGAVGPIAKGGPPTPGGFGSRRIPVVPGLAPPTLPGANVPAPGSASSGGSAIIIGGQNRGDSASAYTGNAIVSGNVAQPMPMAAPGVGPNNPAVQIANSLFSGANGGQGYRMPLRRRPPLRRPKCRRRDC